MKVLVTGGAGFIGSNLVRELLFAGHEVRVIDDLATGRWVNLHEIAGEFEWIHGSILDPGPLARALKGVEVVLHQAAIPSVGRSLRDPITSSQANTGGTVALLTAAKEAGVRRVVYAGSSSVYGNSPQLPKVETMPANPCSPYAVSKHAGELYCRVFASLFPIETVVLRYFNVFGPRQDPDSPYAAVIPKFIRLLAAGEEIAVDGDGSQSRDFTYVANVVQANLKAMTAPAVSGETINVACGRRCSLNDLIGHLGDVLNVIPRVRYLPPRPGDVPHSLADITKAQRLLGYEPAVTLYQGLRMTADWLLSGVTGPVPQPVAAEPLFAGAAVPAPPWDGSPSMGAADSRPPVAAVEDEEAVEVA